MTHFIGIRIRGSKEGGATLIKKKTKFSSYIQMGSGAKSYMRKGFPIYEEFRKFFTIYEEAVCTRSL